MLSLVGASILHCGAKEIIKVSFEARLKFKSPELLAIELALLVDRGPPACPPPEPLPTLVPLGPLKCVRFQVGPTLTPSDTVKSTVDPNTLEEMEGDVAETGEETSEG